MNNDKIINSILLCQHYFKLAVSNFLLNDYTCIGVKTKCIASLNAKQSLDNICN